MGSTSTVIASLSWLLIAMVWLPGHWGMKETVERPRVGLYLMTSVLLLATYVLIFSRSAPGLLALPLTPANRWIGMLGACLAWIGALFAVWARVAIGRNWSGTTATVKQGHALIQSGPYAIVRHPIYCGFLIAMLGAALTIGTLANYLGVLLALLAYAIRIRIEEQVMVQRFSEEYLAYREEVKALVPFMV